MDADQRLNESSQVLFGVGPVLFGAVGAWG